MSDWKKRNDDWRDEDELEEEEECECPWVDSKGKVRETAYCQYLLEKHPMMCLKQKLFDQNGEVDEDALLYEVHSDLRDFVLDNLAKKEKQVLDALRIETNRFASANLEYKLVMVDDDLNMVALPETRNIKSIVTAEDRLCIERKNKQAVQGLLYVRFICFGNGNLVAAHDDSDGFWRRQILVAVKDRDPARVDDPFLIEKLTEELPGILLWMLEGLHRLLTNRYQFTISERSRRNLEAAMEDGDNLSQFMQAQAYVRFRPDSEERSTYLYRAYTKWCEDNLESPATQKKFSQFLLKNAGKYGLTFSKHIEGKFAFVKRSETMKSPVGTLSDRTVLRSKMEGLCPDKFCGFRGVCVHPAFAAA